MLACEEEGAIKEFKEKGFSKNELEIIHRWWLAQNRKEASISLLNQPTAEEKIKQLSLPNISSFYKIKYPKSH
ncbi:MAG: hypothetical protein PHN72_06165 [Bacilli bacterium]|nr:hypothetical protein [Bacilli bacterium]